MHKTPAASVSSGPVAPTIMGPDKDFKEIYIVSGLVLFLAVIVAAFWYYSQSDDVTPSSGSVEAFSGAQISQVVKGRTDTMPVGASVSTTHVEAAPLATRTTDVLHDDIFFEIGRKGLSDDGRAALLRHAEFLKSEPGWGIVLQGYTDQQGSMSYNRILGLKRAEAVKQHLITLGVPETSIRTVSLGEEGALCVDTSDFCRRMNRRVHMEFRMVGQEHMILPAVVPAIPVPVVENSQPLIDPVPQADESFGTADSLLESTPPLPESDVTSPREETTLPSSSQ